MPNQSSNRVQNVILKQFIKGYSLLLFLLCLVVAQCSTSPTGRKQINLLPESQMETMGDQAFQQMRAKNKTEPINSKSYELVKCVSEELLVAMDFDPKEWEISVFEDPTPNAFALPGKNIGVHSGMIELVDNADQLAAVIGHEIGHVLAHHGNERASQQLLVQGGLAVAEIYLGKDDTTDKVLMGALGIGAQVGVLLPFSRKHEEEADELGLRYMAKAGFNPQTAQQLWLKMEKQSAGAPPEFLSTHPSAASRAERLGKMAGQYLSEYQAKKASQKCHK